MRNDVRHFIQTCQSCATKKLPILTPRVSLVPIQPLAKLERWQTDTIGPFKATKNGNVHIIIFIEILTRYVEAFAIKDLKSETISRSFVENICQKYGCPSELMSDNGKAYCSNLMKDICEMLGTKTVRCTPYHAAGNGGAKRANKSVIEIMSHFVDKNQLNWDEVLKYTVFATNSAINQSLKRSPFYLMYLTEATLLLDLVLQTPIQTYKDLNDYKVRAQHDIVGLKVINIL